MPYMKTSPHPSLLFRILSVFGSLCLALGLARAGTMQLEDPIATLGNWTTVNGSAPTLATSGTLSALPYLQINNGVARAELPATVSGNWTLTCKALHSQYSRTLWIGVFNAAGTQGYGFLWNSSNSGSWGGQGYVTIQKFSLGAQPAWADVGSALSANAGSGQIATAGPMAKIELSRDAASNTLYLRINGIPKAQVTDSSFTSFKRVYLRGNTTSSFDDVCLLTETPPTGTAITNAVNLGTGGFGAVGDGVTDNQLAITNAIASAKSQSKALYVPPGVFRHSGTLNLDGISLFGHGYPSVLVASTPASSMIRLTGTGKSIKTLRVACPSASSRLGSTASTTINVFGATNFEIRDSYIEKSASVGIMVNATPSSSGTIANNWVHDTFADGIHLTNGANNITVSGNRVRNPGDDMIAVISKVGEGQCSNITIVNNDGRGQPTAGRGITSAGSNNVTIQNNVIHNSLNAGILVTSNSSYDHQAGTGAQVLDNTLVNCGVNEGGGHPIIYVSGREGFLITNTLVDGNTINGVGSAASKDGIRVNGHTQGVTLSNNHLSNVTRYGVALEEQVKNITVSGNTMTNIGRVAIYANNDVTASPGTLNIQSNILTNIQTQGVDSPSYVIRVRRSPSTELGWSSISITNNTWTNPGGYAVSKYIQNDFPFGTITGNSPTN